MRLGSLLLLALVVASAAVGASARSNGNLLLLRGQHVFVVTPAGADVRELTPPGFDVESAAWSRDGRRLAFSSARTGLEQVWVVSANGGSLRRVSHRTDSCVDPAWSPDGRWIAFSCRLGWHKLLVARVGGRTDRVVTHSGGVIAEEDPAWTPDSKTLLFTRSNGAHLLGVYSVSAAGRGLRRLVTGASEPSVSPNGRRLAFIRGNHLWIAQRDGAGAHAVTSGPIAEAGPDWGS